jgi:hypothetical protein
MFPATKKNGMQMRQALLLDLSFNLYRLRHRYLLLRMSTETNSFWGFRRVYGEGRVAERGLAAPPGHHKAVAGSSMTLIANLRARAT